MDELDELVKTKEALRLAKQDLRQMAMSNSHGQFCKHWDECWYKCSGDCINWEWRYDNV